MASRTPFDWIISTSGRLLSPFGTNSALDKLALAILTLFVLAIFGLSVALPEFNYDMVPYLGAALHAAGETNIHQQAWGIAKEAMPPEVYQDISAANEYRQSQSGDPEAFASILPLYSVKIGYIHLLNLLAPVFGYIKTAFWSGHLAGLFAGLTCCWWLLQRGISQGAVVILPLLLLLNYLDMTSSPSPDVIATLLILISLYFWTAGREWMPLVFLFVAFLFRPDTVIFIFAMVLAQLAFGQRVWKTGALFVLTLIASVFIRDAGNHPGWWVHYYFSTVTIQNTLVGFAHDFSIVSWAKGMARGVLMSLTEFTWPSLLAFIGVALIYCIKSGMQFTQIQKTALLACILTIGGKFLAFPLPDDRIYMAFIIGAALILLEVVRPKFGWRNKISPTAA